jgi:Pectate lyase superfamily protein
MPKSIPTLGDSNWGTPLNAHISQLQNPTNGGINSFEQFSGRPTTLTADDAGKTYLYTQTGNLHQWTGTIWKVLNESVINVKDYGAVGDFNPETGTGTNDTAAIQPLLERAIGGNSNKSIFFPQGSYGVNLVFRFETPSILGKGNSSTKISSYTNDGNAFTYTRNYNWVPREVKQPRSKERGIVKLQIPQISLVSQFCGFACNLN